MSSRTCAKPACNVSASATLVYDYSGSTAILEPLNPEAHPMHYDLCTAHADALRVPKGWALVDHRSRYPAAIAS
jgi:hypothetical protein